jgi:aspartate-semialdehyde dehydrogenase
MGLPPLPTVMIVGATGLVGEELLGLLAERSFPRGTLRVIGSERSVGRELQVGGERLRLEPLEASSFADVDLVFMAADTETSRRWAPVAAAGGAVVIDNSSAFRLDPAVPLVVPEINAHSLPPPTAGGRIIANPNCSTVLALMGATPIDRIAGVRRMLACTYQAASGGGRALLEMLERQARGWAAGTADDPGRPYHFNLFSHDSPVDAAGDNQEEAKLRHETARIWDRPDLPVSATCVRVPVPRSHAIALHLELERPVSVEEARAAVAAFPGVRLVDDPVAGRFPEPRDAAGGDEVLVGRIRHDPAMDPDRRGPRGLAMFLCGDQVRKGAALNAVQIAETLLRNAGHAEPGPAVGSMA